MKSSPAHMTVTEVAAHQAKHFGRTMDFSQPQVKPTTTKGKLKMGRRPNKTEAGFGLILEARRRKGEFRTVEFEAVTLRVGAGARYTCDFLCEVELPNSQIEQADFDVRPIFFEIKGKQKWDDAIAKFKTAVDRYGRIFRFEMWDRIDGQWRQIA